MRTNFWRNVCAAGGCLAVLACGSSEPDSPLILGSEGKDAVPGMRTLTADQGRGLQDAITSSGARCELVERAYLRRAEAGQSESWDVRCADGNYSVDIFADGTAADVQRCFDWSWEGCADPYAGRRFRQYRDRGVPSAPRSPGTGELNPDLGKLLEPMTSKDAKVD